MQHPVGVRRRDAATRRSRNQPFLDKVRLIDFFERVGFFAHRGTDRTKAHGAAAEFVYHQRKNLAVGRVESDAVDAEHFECLDGGAFVDDAGAAHLSYVPAAPEDAVCDTGRATAAAAENVGSLFGEFDAQDAGATHENLDDIFFVVKFQAVLQAEAVAEGACQEPAARRGAHEREVLEREVHAPCRRAGVEHDVEPEIFHGGVEVFLDNAVQAVDFVDKEDVVFLQAREEAGEVARFFENGTARDVDVHAHLFGDDARKRRLAEPWRACEQTVVERIATVLGCLNCYRKAFLDVVLTGKFVEARRAQVAVGIAFVKRAFLRRNNTLIVHISNSRFVILEAEGR